MLNTMLTHGSMTIPWRDTPDLPEESYIAVISLQKQNKRKDNIFYTVYTGKWKTYNFKEIVS